MSTHNKRTTHMNLYNSLLERNIVFFLVFMGVLVLTYGLLYVIDFLPEKPDTKIDTLENDVAVIEEQVDHRDVGGEEVGELEDSEPMLPVDPEPVAIIFDSLDREVSVLNPIERSIAALDAALLEGVVRHPDSADFENEGTIFLFGHSSYLPNVINKNFQAFNGIQELEWGDTIRLRSSDREYVYRVDRVYEVQASDAEVAIERGEAKLTLATCDTFGSKDDRFIVEASLVDDYTLEGV